MNWTQEDGKLVSKTDFGTYEITVNDSELREFGVRLIRDGEVLMTGTGSSIGSATERVEEDYAYRMGMWETV